MFYTTTTEIDLLTQFQDLAAYNSWAIERLVNWLKAKPEALLEADAASSFPGIKATLVHIRDVEREWLGNLQETTVPAYRRKDQEEESVTAVLESLEEQAVLFLGYMEGLTAEALQEDCYCQVGFAGEICRPKFEIIQHCMNHSTYHRGQVVTIGHQVGLKDAPMTDYLYYVLREKEVRGYRQKAGASAQKSFLAVNFFSK
jgi:uncharacterized damage-inducible protein DinB